MEDSQVPHAFSQADSPLLPDITGLSDDELARVAGSKAEGPGGTWIYDGPGANW